MNPRFYILACTVGLPTLFQGYLVGLIALTLRLVERPHFDGPVFCAWWRPKVDDKWGYATTIAGFIGKPSWWNDRTRFHELRHFEDYVLDNLKAAILCGCVIGPALSWWWALGIWATSGALWTVPNFLAAIIEHKRPGVSWLQAAYYLSDHEQDAYAQEKAYADGYRDRWES